MSDRSEKEGADGPLLSMSVRVDDVTAGGVAGVVEADERQRSAIAAALDLERLDKLSFDYSVRREGKKRFALEGRVVASYRQNCVVTLELLDGQLDEPVSLRFWPLDDIEQLEHGESPEEAEIELEGPEPIEDGMIDVGQIAYEVLASGIDPYPRKPGAALDWEDPRAESGDSDNPFAALNTLKAKGDDGDGS